MRGSMNGRSSSLVHRHISDVSVEGNVVSISESLNDASNHNTRILYYGVNTQLQSR